jgi:Protein of unknown function (DUF3275)
MNSITVSGQLAIKSAHGRYGQYNVGRLTTPLGEFIVKDAQLDLYEQGKYDGDFVIDRIHLWVSNFGSRMLTEIRAIVSKMTLCSSDSLTQDEAQRLTPHEIDPVEEQAATSPCSPTQAPPPTVLTAPTTSKVSKLNPLKDPTPFGQPPATKPEDTAPQEDPTDADRQLFGLLYPLADVIKLDATIDRRLLRQQRDRLKQLGYMPDPLTQSFRLAA